MDVQKLKAEIKQLKSERTAWRVTAENAEKQLEDLKASIGEPKHIGLEQAQDEGLLNAPFELVGWCAPRPDVVDWRSYEPEAGTPLYALLEKTND